MSQLPVNANVGQKLMTFKRSTNFEFSLCVLIEFNFPQQSSVNGRTHGGEKNVTRKGGANYICTQRHA